VWNPIGASQILQRVLSGCVFVEIRGARHTCVRKARHPSQQERVDPMLKLGYVFGARVGFITTV
jgi:hypothetical protein